MSQESSKADFTLNWIVALFAVAAGFVMGATWSRPAPKPCPTPTPCACEQLTNAVPPDMPIYAKPEEIEIPWSDMHRERPAR